MTTDSETDLRSASSGDSEFEEFLTRVVAVTATLSLALAGFLLVYHAHLILLAGGAAVLFAIFVHSVAEPLRSYFSLRNGVAVGIVGGAFLGVCALLAVALGPQVAEEVTRLGELAPGYGKTLRAQAVARFPSLGEFLGSQAALQPLRGLGSLAGSLLKLVYSFSTTFVVVLILGTFVAASPERHLDVFYSFVPKSRRHVVERLLARVRYSIGRWLMARFVSMFVIGLLTTLGLWLLGVPYFLALGALAGALTLLPFVGPALALAPILVVAGSESPTLLLPTFGLYCLLQITESNLITPKVESKATDLPTGLLLFGQFGLTYLAGPLGLILSTPILILVIAVARRILLGEVYQQDGARLVIPTALEAKEHIAVS